MATLFLFVLLVFGPQDGDLTTTAPRGTRSVFRSPNVKINWVNDQPVVSWPEGIKLVNSESDTSGGADDQETSSFVSARGITSAAASVAAMATATNVAASTPVLSTMLPPAISKSYQSSWSSWSSSSSSSSLPSSSSSPSSLPSLSTAAAKSKSALVPPIRRTYRWTNNELLISCNMTALADPTCTRLMPPITWMSASGSRCKVLHDSTMPTSSVIEIAVSRALAEDSLSALRMSGFKREDIYRMLDKGPWVLAFDIGKTLPKILSDLELDLSMNKTEALHIVSHCPYLIAQYARYRGRDVYSTVRALIDVGYDAASLAEDVMRFPSMLAAPPDRLRGWRALLEGFGIAHGPGLFGKMLKRAPFMFHINPPHLWSSPGARDDVVVSDIDDVSTTASAFVVYESLRILQLLVGLNIPDLDRIVRTQPSILLCNAEEVSKRCIFLMNLFLDKQYQIPVTSVSFTSAAIPEREEPTRLALLSADAAPRTTPAADVEPDRLLSSVFIEHMERSIDIASAATAFEARRRAHEQLGILLSSCPSILSNEFEQMRSACNALRRVGLRRSDVVQLARRHPPLLSRPASDLQNLCMFLKLHVGVRKAELVPFIIRYPAILSAEIDDLLPKVQYLKEAMRGTPSMLKKFPAYFSFDLDTHIRPRAEFLRALGLDPLINGLPFLVNAQSVDLSYTAGMQADVFAQFKAAFGDMWRKKKAKDGEDHKGPKSLDSGSTTDTSAVTVSASATATGTVNVSTTTAAPLPFSGTPKSWNEALLKSLDDDGIMGTINEAFDDDEEDF